MELVTASDAGHAVEGRAERAGRDGWPAWAGVALVEWRAGAVGLVMR
jgi:hypothetical protein